MWRYLCWPDLGIEAPSRSLKSEKLWSDKEVKDLKALLILKDERILAIACKVVSYLKSKELDEKDCEIDEKIEMNGLDEDGEYDAKVNYILENENDFEIFENVEPEENMSETKEYHCNLCENVC